MAEEPRTFHITDGWTGERFETVPRAALSACQEERDEARAYVKVLNESWVEQMRRAEAAETALRACQEELARVNAFAAEIAQDATDALAARDELARAIKETPHAAGCGLYLGLRCNCPTRDLQRRTRAALSSEATKGERN